VPNGKPERSGAGKRTHAIKSNKTKDLGPMRREKRRIRLMKFNEGIRRLSEIPRKDRIKMR
jgi:hypothetical protein